MNNQKTPNPTTLKFWNKITWTDNVQSKPSEFWDAGSISPYVQDYHKMDCVNIQNWKVQ